MIMPYHDKKPSKTPNVLSRFFGTANSFIVRVEIELDKNDRFIGLGPSITLARTSNLREKNHKALKLPCLRKNKI